MLGPNPISDFFRECRTRTMRKIAYPLRKTAAIIVKQSRRNPNVLQLEHTQSHGIDNLATDTRYRYRWQFGYDVCLNRYRKLTKPMEDGERSGLLSITKKKKIIFPRRKLSTFDPCRQIRFIIPPIRLSNVALSRHGEIKFSKFHRIARV